MEVDEVERQWRTLSGLSFRVRAVDGRRFTITYDEAADTWDVQPIHSENKPVGRICHPTYGG